MKIMQMLSIVALFLWILINGVIHLRTSARNPFDERKTFTYQLINDAISLVGQSKFCVKVNLLMVSLWSIEADRNEFQDRTLSL
jgi:hypothetical protein